jgi:formate hydrogenlyase subunit 3/multisubunit Na+/H+ antiporter MnhD subunit
VSALLILLVLPLAGALMVVVLPQKATAPAALACVFVAAAGAGVLAVQVATQGTLRLELGGWAPPLGIALAVDGLAASLLAMAALVVAGVALVARHTMAPDMAGPRAAFGFWPLMLMLWAALNVVFVSRDLFNLYVGLELLSLSAVALVAIGGKPEAIAAAIRYLFFALAGSLLFLAGVVLIYAGHGTLDIDLIAGRIPAPPDALALGLMTVGLMVKTALFPFHVWLPPAHAGAPAPASALLSALVPKASFVIMLRLWFEAMPDQATDAALLIIALMGTAAVIWGSLRAMSKNRLKLIVAYSTVAQIGYLFVAFPLASNGASDGATGVPWSAGAWNGAVFLAISHGLAKAAMFLAVGQWIAVTSSDRLEDLRGMAQAVPMTVFAFALAAITLTGLPPSGGFTGKYLVMTAAFASGQWVWALVMALGGLLAVVYVYRPLALMFTPSQGTDQRPHDTLPPRSQQAVPLLLAGASVLLGVASAEPFDLLSIGRPDVAEDGL